MARCREEHNFPDWVAMEYKLGGYKPMSKKAIEERKRQWIEDRVNPKEHPIYGLFRSHKKILWKRNCEKCGKEQMRLLKPFEIPDPDMKSKIKTSNKAKQKRIHEKKYGRNMSAYKDEKISKGAQPW